ncbi:hypothetical protein EGW08_008226 [Elysia chlorotica]|uniref:G-protein coupled receptors family 2 profile 2 domain-containing protein n=1 Tax=Elysia chlorotica TaxID=188477 RepID=A0A433TR18_ELYCH|nr:hypothetical protein EGW08_008226 [Elysia chlorotica]
MPCSCEKPFCTFHNLCCPDKDHQDLGTGNTDQAQPQGQSLEETLDSSRESVNQHFGGSDSPALSPGSARCEGAVLFVRSCPARYRDEESSAWDVSISCRHFQRVFQATDEDSFFHLSMQENSACFLHQQPPLGVSTGPSCDSRFFGDIISSCNFTGEWAEPDANLETLCQSNVGLTHRIRYMWMTFSNIFCMMCNVKSMSKYREPCNTELRKYNPAVSMDNRSPFDLLLGAFDSSKQTSRSKISFLQDLQVKCTPGKLLENGTCFTPIDNIRGLSYKFRVFYRPLFDGVVPQNRVREYFNLSSEKHEDLMAMFSFAVAIKLDTLDDVIDKSSVDARYGAIYLPGPQSQWDLLNTSRLVLYVDARFTSIPTLLRDEVESTLVTALFFENIIYTSKNKVDFNLKFQPMLLSGGDILESKCFEAQWNPQHLSCRKSSFESTAEYYSEIEVSDLISFTPLLTCPFVEFNTSDYELRSDRYNLTREGNLALQIQGHTVELSANWTDMNMIIEDNSEGKIRVCKSVLEEKLANVFAKTSSRIAQFRYYFTLTCMGISMFCLALTLVTYLSFQVLRSPAGVNNMFLCFSLLAASAFLLASAHMRPADPLCTTVGVATHFLWLNMFCWAFVCCFHMFRTFTKKNRSTASTGRAKILSLARKVLFCLAVPSMIVITIMVTSRLTHGGGSIGYGLNSCYLDSELLVFAGMIFPLSLMVVSNLVFFAVTVYKIRSVRKLQGGQDVTPGAPRDIYVYVKLSSLTGCFWVLAIAGKYLDSHVLGVTSDFFIGLQGAFIFWSYVCNQRVSNLYRRAFGMTVTITSRTGTITRIAKDAVVVEARNK